MVEKWSHTHSQGRCISGLQACRAVGFAEADLAEADTDKSFVAPPTRLCDAFGTFRLSHSPFEDEDDYEEWDSPIS